MKNQVLFPFSGTMKMHDGRLLTEWTCKKKLKKNCQYERQAASWNQRMIELHEPPSEREVKRD